MRQRLLVVVLLVVLSGCTGLIDDVSIPEKPDPNPVWTPTPDGPGSGSNGDSGGNGADDSTSTGTGDEWTPTGSTDNPWGQSVVPVRINDSVADGRNKTALLQEAIDYWDRSIPVYTNHDYRFRLADDPENARVELRFLEDIENCNGPSPNAAGCARLLEDDETARDLEVVEVESAGSNAAVTTTTIHEFGHLLGLDHQDEPLYLMAHQHADPVVDAKDRENPWVVRDLTVAVEFDSLDGDRSAIDDQVGHAVSYYDEGAAGTVPNVVSFDRRSSARTAEVIVTNNASRGCTVSSGSGVSVYGQNRDQDSAVELFTRAVICIDVDDDATAWHVGYWLGWAMGLEESELASPFQNDNYSYIRSEWWTD